MGGLRLLASYPEESLRRYADGKRKNIIPFAPQRE
jgi:hypothetical protein